MSPEMIETARLLMVHLKCPEGLVMHVVSKGAAVEEYACLECGEECGEEMLEDVGVCPECGWDGWISTVTYPNPDTVPALGNSHGGLANVGPLRYAVRDADPHAAVRWCASTATCRPIAGWCVIGGGNAVTLAAYRQSLAHALALAFLAAR